MLGPHRDGAEFLAAVVGAAVDALHGAGGRKNVRDQVPVAAKLVHDRAQQPLLLRRPRYRLAADRRAAGAPADLRHSTRQISVSERGAGNYEIQDTKPLFWQGVGGGVGG